MKQLLCMLYHVYYGECSEELSKLIPAADFRHQIIEMIPKYHQHHLKGWCSTTVHFISNFLPRTVKFCNDLPSAILPMNFDKGVFKKRVYSYMKGRQRTSDFSVGASVHELL